MTSNRLTRPRPRCKRESCRFNFYGMCDPYKYDYLKLDKNGKCLCYEKIPKMTVKELMEECENDSSMEKIFNGSAATIYSSLGIKMNKKDKEHAKKLAKNLTSI